jgi:gamma-glutamyltranspeptidase / glutathione hydrolase
MTPPRSAVSTARPVTRGAVVSAHPAATEAGREAFRSGGNVIDAAVAAAWALCVCEPSGSGLGGQTVLLLRLHGETVVIDGHSSAPARISRQSVTRAQQRFGYRATTVPTTPATLAYVQRRFGVLRLADALAPAIRLAEDGYEISLLQHRQLRWCRSALDATPAARRFLRAGRPYEPRDVFVQPALAACLRRLADSGVDDFYRGAIARSIERDMRRNGGLLERSDLEAVGEPVERGPLSGCYRNRVVMTMPAPGGGPQLLGALARLEEWGDEGRRRAADCWYEAVAHAVRDAFEQRERDHRRSDAPQPVPVSHGVGSEDGGETTHLCAADVDGNVVSLTQSIQSLFGAKVANEEYGFFYNNYLTTCPRRSHTHRLAGGCPARSNAAPTIVLPPDAERPMLALGAAGSRRIISSLVQVISGTIDLRLTLDDAVARPRIHPRLSGKVWLEEPAATPDLVGTLSEEFGPVEVRPAHSYTLGAVNALAVSESGIAAAADPRREGTGGQW